MSSTEQDEWDDASICCMWLEVARRMEWCPYTPQSEQGYKDVTRYVVEALEDIKDPQKIRAVFENPVFESVLVVASIAWQLEILTWMVKYSDAIGLNSPDQCRRFKDMAIRVRLTQVKRAVWCQQEAENEVRNKAFDLLMRSVDNAMYTTWFRTFFSAPGNPESYLDVRQQQPSIASAGSFAWKSKDSSDDLLAAVRTATKSITRFERAATIHDVELPDAYMFLDVTYDSQKNTRRKPPRFDDVGVYSSHFDFISYKMPFLQYPSKSSSIQINASKARLVHLCRTMTEAAQCPLLVAAFGGAAVARSLPDPAWNTVLLVAWCSDQESFIIDAAMQSDSSTPRLVAQPGMQSSTTPSPVRQTSSSQSTLALTPVSKRQDSPLQVSQIDRRMEAEIQQLTSTIIQAEKAEQKRIDAFERVVIPMKQAIHDRRAMTYNRAAIPMTQSTVDRSGLIFNNSKRDMDMAVAEESRRHERAMVPIRVLQKRRDELIAHLRSRSNMK